MNIRRNKFWQNTIRRYGRNMPYYALPETIGDLSDLILRAENENVRIRAVGSGHSFSDVALPDIYLVDLKKMNRVLPLDMSTLKPRYRPRNLVQVQAGITVQRFNHEMEKLGLCVVNMGGIDEQTLAGAISTGTHGTGLNLPSFPGMVRSMVLVTRGGQRLRLEPEDGISDPHQPQPEGIELVQDDKRFYSALISLGCFGIVYSYILELEPMYYLEETKKCHDWDWVAPRLADRSLFYETDGVTPIRGVMVQVNPYKIDKRGRTAIVVYHRLLPGGLGHRTIGESTRNWLSSIAARLPVSYWYAHLRARNNPQKYPKTLDGSLRSLKDKVYRNKGYRVLYQGMEYIKIRAYDSEFAFDMTDGKNDYLAALEEMFALAESSRAANMYQTSPMGLRFVDASPAYLSLEYGKKVAYIDAPFVLGTPRSDEILDRYQEIMLWHKGMPHWGKINSALDGKPGLIVENFPKLPEWEEVYRDYNANGTFSNQFSDRLRLGFITAGPTGPVIV
jgi:L-gulono-1,4-lactone dehydrogenase